MFAETVSIFPAAFRQDIFYVDVHSHRFAPQWCAAIVWCKIADFGVCK